MTDKNDRYDMLGNVLVTVGGILSNVGSRVLRGRNEQLADELAYERESARKLAELAYRVGRAQQARAEPFPEFGPDRSGLIFDVLKAEVATWDGDDPGAAVLADVDPGPAAGPAAAAAVDVDELGHQDHAAADDVDVAAAALGMGMTSAVRAAMGAGELADVDEHQDHAAAAAAAGSRFKMRRR